MTVNTSVDISEVGIKQGVLDQFGVSRGDRGNRSVLMGKYFNGG